MKCDYKWNGFLPVMLYSWSFVSMYPHFEQVFIKAAMNLRVKGYQRKVKRGLENTSNGRGKNPRKRNAQKHNIKSQSWMIEYLSPMAPKVMVACDPFPSFGSMYMGSSPSSGKFLLSCDITFSTWHVVHQTFNILGSQLMHRITLNNQVRCRTMN